MTDSNVDTATVDQNPCNARVFASSGTIWQQQAEALRRVQEHRSRHISNPATPRQVLPGERKFSIAWQGTRLTRKHEFLFSLDVHALQQRIEILDREIAYFEALQQRARQVMQDFAIWSVAEALYGITPEF